MDLHELKQHLQSHFSDGLVTIIGSGLSCAEGLPGMAELATHLTTSLPAKLDTPTKEEWSSIIPALASTGLEAALLKHAPSAELESAISIATAELISAREQAITTEVFNGSRRLRLSRLLGYMLKPNSGMPIITTNYDRLVEIAVEEAGLGVDTAFVGCVVGNLDPRESQLSFCRDVSLRNRNVVLTYKNRAVISKPHGSIDWYLRQGKPVRYAGELPGATRLLITPGQNKFRNGYESPFDLHRERANKAIDAAARFLILGYGFNDDHLETHLMPAIKAGRPTLLLTYELSEIARQLATAYKNVTALECANVSAVVGTRIIRSTESTFLPGLSLWDVNEFVTGVLEP